MSNIHNLNPGEKKWKIYAHNIVAREGTDDLIFEVSANKQILFKQGTQSYTLADLSNTNTNTISSGGDLSLSNLDISENLILTSGRLDFFQSNGQVVSTDPSGIINRLDIIDTNLADLSTNQVLTGNDLSLSNQDISENFNILGRINFFQSNSQVAYTDPSGIINRLNIIDSSIQSLLSRIEALEG